MEQETAGAEDSQSDVSLYSIRASEVEGNEAWDEVLSDLDRAQGESSNSNPEYELSEMEEDNLELEDEEIDGA
jgi:predicted nucleotidyltransferase